MTYVEYPVTVQRTSDAYYASSDAPESAWWTAGTARTDTGLVRHLNRVMSAIHHGTSWSGNVRVLDARGEDVTGRALDYRAYLNHEAKMARYARADRRNP